MDNDVANLHINQASIEGIITKIWSRNSGDIIFRLASYDETAKVLEEKDGRGRERRQPHYITILVEEGCVDGRAVDLRKGDHVRVTGPVVDEVYWEGLRDFLVKAKAEYLLTYLPDSVVIGEIKTGRVSTQIVAKKLTRFTS